MRSPPRPESVAEAEEVFLVDGVQHVGHGALDDLVLQRRHRQRPSAAVRFGYVDPPARRRPIRPALDSRHAGLRAYARGLLRSPATSCRRSRRRRSWLSRRTRPAELPVVTWCSSAVNFSFLLRLAASVCAPAPVTRRPGPVSGTCFAGSPSPWSPPLAPSAPPPDRSALFADFTATIGRV